MGAFQQSMKAVLDEVSTDKVYTFCFWGVSQFLDCIRWEICGGIVPGIRVDFNKLAGAAPVYVAMYEMANVGEHEADQRHLPSRKRYYFNVALWSQLHPPGTKVLRYLQGRDRPHNSSPRLTQMQRSRSELGKSSVLARVFACCTSRPS